MGRPSIFTPELAERLCQRIAEGRSLRKACGLPDMPSKRTVLRWLAAQDPTPPVVDGAIPRPGPFDAFRAQYARACAIRGEARGDEIDDYKAQLLAGTLKADAARVLIDATKWQASKEAPKKYGEAITIKGDKDNPIETRTRHDMTDAELLALAAGRLRGQD